MNFSGKTMAGTIRRMRSALVGLGAGLLVLCGVAPVQAADTEYRMGTGDVLSIKVYSQPDLTTEARIDERGAINFPLIGAVRMSGLTPGAGAAEIERRLVAGKYLIAPNVNLNILQYRAQQVSVLGRVNRPGKFPLDKLSSVSDVLALAGGLSIDAADTITVVRERAGKIEYLNIDMLNLFKPGGASSDVRVSDGDIINVPKQQMFYIYGEVQRPGSFRLERNMTVVQALSQGGGLTLRGTQRGIRILRKGNGSEPLQEIPAELSTPVLPDDVIYVKESLF